MKEIPEPGGASSNTQKSPCTSDFGFGFLAIDKAAEPPPPTPTVTTQKYRQADGNVLFFFFNQ